MAVLFIEILIHIRNSGLILHQRVCLMFFIQKTIDFDNKLSTIVIGYEATGFALK